MPVDVVARGDNVGGPRCYAVGVDIITYAIPFFLLLMGVELLVGRRRGRTVFRHHDVLTNLSLGTLQILVTVVGAVLISSLYLLLFEHRLFELSATSWWVIVFAFFGVDFFYYWFHRASHRVMIFWATHAPHHSSEDYNLAVALRQGPLQPLASQFFYLPLALIGVPFPLFATMTAISLLYQFWIHTELIDKLGPLELILNTPSHHRVHHGCNGTYIDKNHGGILIIWDRMFGTFVGEEAPAVYGTVSPAGTWNPLRATWLPWVDIGTKLKHSRGPVDVVRAFFGPPEWLPAGMVAGAPIAAARAKFDGRATTKGARWAVTMFAMTLVMSVTYLVAAPLLTTWASVVAATWLMLSFGSIGALLDGRAWAKHTEVVRLVALAPLLWFLTTSETAHRPTTPWTKAAASVDADHR